MTFWPNGGFAVQNRGRSGAILTPSELVLTFRDATFGKNRSRNATVRVQQTGTRCDGDRLNLYAIAMGQIIKSNRTDYF